MPVNVLVGDCRTVLDTLPAESVDCVVTSPPYFGLRDYGVEGQIGLEQTPTAFVDELVCVFRAARRVLRDDGTLWLNLGDSYAGGGGGNYSKSVKEIAHGQHQTNIRNRPGWLAAAGLKAKDLIGIPWRVAFALQADGWWLRSDIIWHKPNPMPESIRDRPTSAHEHVFLFAKSERYFYDAEAVKEPAIYAGSGRKSRRKGTFGGKGADVDETIMCRPFRAVTETRNLRNVWTVTPTPFKGAHFATFPPALIEPCIKAGCPAGGTVLDPFGGAGTTGVVADRLDRSAILIELNPDYAEMARERIADDMISRV